MASNTLPPGSKSGAIEDINPPRKGKNWIASTHSS
jgi:hypothetical protein